MGVISEAELIANKLEPTSVKPEWIENVLESVAAELEDALNFTDESADVADLKDVPKVVRGPEDGAEDVPNRVNVCCKLLMDAGEVNKDNLVSTKALLVIGVIDPITTLDPERSPRLPKRELYANITFRLIHELPNATELRS